MTPDEHDYLNADGKAFNGNWAAVRFVWAMIAVAIVFGIISLF